MITTVISKFFTVGRCFALMLIILFGCFLWAGTESLMTSWGFETKTSLQQKLAKEVQVRQQLEQTNKDLVLQAAQAKKDQDRAVKELETLTSRHKQLDDTAKRIVNDVAKKTQETRKTVQKEKVVTDTTITLPIVEVNHLSQTNIDAVHDAFDQLLT
jgi:preprotein translocase subunit SecF